MVEELVNDPDMLGSLRRLVGTIESGDRILTLINYEAPAVDCTPPGEEYQRMVPTGQWIVTLTLEPKVPVRFTKRVVEVATDG